MGFATLALLKRPGVKDAFRNAGEGDSNGLQQMVPRPKGALLIKILGLALTFTTCMWLYSRGSGYPNIEPEVALSATAIICVCALLLNPFLEQFSFRDSRGFLARKPVATVGLLALITAVFAAPFVPHYLKKKEVTQTLYVPANNPVHANTVSLQHEAMRDLVETQAAILTQSKRGGLILDIEPGPVSYTHLTLPTTPYV